MTRYLTRRALDAVELARGWLAVAGIVLDCAELELQRARIRHNRSVLVVRRDLRSDLRRAARAEAA